MFPENHRMRIEVILTEFSHLLRHDFIDRLNRSTHFEIMRDVPEIKQWFDELRSFDSFYTPEQRDALEKTINDLQNGINLFLDFLRNYLEDKSRGGEDFDARKWNQKISQQHNNFVEKFRGDSFAFYNTLLDEPSYEQGKKYDLFISYSTANKEIAEDLKKRMEQHDLDVFLAHESIRIGKWKDQIMAALQGSRMAVILMTEAALDSDWVKYEIGALWALGRPVAPALLGIDARRVPEIISSEFQAQPIASEVERERFVHELDKFLKAQEKSKV